MSSHPTPGDAPVVPLSATPKTAPAEVFAVISNETRLAILEALWAAEMRPVTFSDLHRAVGMKDSAQFNYHLRQLLDRFVKKSDDGYDLTFAGKRVMRTLISGMFTDDVSIDAFPLPGTCVSCGETLVATYEREHLTVACPACDRVHSAYPYPPAGIYGRTRDELMAGYNRWVRHLYGLAANGVCPECGSSMGSKIVDGEHCLPELEIAVSHRCVQCDASAIAAVGMTLLDQPDVVSFYRDHGIDLRTIPYWELPWCVGDEHTTVIQDDPWMARVDISLEAEELRVTLDDTFDVVAVERAKSYRRE
ncbi:helix-turn-helix transcriptional regulator [Haladaptatus sp. DYSN1]|uniref:ArsR/SmtB family transcription factor n=1 Tax=unclassified Haladaptatus TaxID=2622732 RepID=UPI002405D94A|nr:helix-turn-helix domain-containing protein [Haladaptatus sp. DYSN1]